MRQTLAKKGEDPLVMGLLLIDKPFFREFPIALTLRNSLSNVRLR